MPATGDASGQAAVPPEQAAGEFIGLAHFSAAGAAALREVWALRSRWAGRALRQSDQLRQAYLSDALNAIAGGGVRLRPVFIDGTWREIDTQQDLARAERSLST